MTINTMDSPFGLDDIINSRYRILKQLGYGGFGCTYLAEDCHRFNEHCVLKEFAPKPQEDLALTKARELFQREAKVLYQLQHPQIPKFRELFTYYHQQRECLLLVQDYIDGQTYHTMVNNRSRQRMKFSEAEARQLLHQILPVLAYIHSMGVIHRDITPDNLILRSSDGLTILIDFGSVKQVMTDAEALSPMGTTLGKSGYAPIEQIELGTVCASSDLYGLAATAMVLLTGKEPRQLIEPDYCWNWQGEVTLSSKLEWILTKMLAPNPRDRFSNATEVIKALQAPILRSSNAALTEGGEVKKQLPSDRKIWSFSLLIFVAALIAILLLGYLWWWQKNVF